MYFDHMDKVGKSMQVKQASKQERERERGGEKAKTAASIIWKKEGK